jgi:hypothetical protein
LTDAGDDDALADVEAQGNIAAPAGAAPTGAAAAILAEIEAIVASGAMSREAAMFGFQQYVAQYDTDNDQLVAAARGLPALSEREIAAVHTQVGIAHGEHLHLPEEEEDVEVEVPANVDPNAQANAGDGDLGGGALNDALSKDIQYKLIGGAYGAPIIGGPLYRSIARQSANVRYGKPPYANFAVWFAATMWKLHTESRLGSQHAAEDEWDISTTVKMSKFIERNIQMVNYKLKLAIIMYL